MFELIKEPWPWYVSGPMIAAVLLLLIFSDRTFGVSSSLRAMCSMTGAGKKYGFFSYNWKGEKWNLAFVFGTLLGGFLAGSFMQSDEPLRIAETTVAELQALGFSSPDQLIPEEIYNWDSIFTLKGFIFIILGGFLIGFGARWAGGCTSGHAITGLSNLQLPSLIAVVGFFIGGLFLTHFLLPFISRL